MHEFLGPFPEAHRRSKNFFLPFLPVLHQNEAISGSQVSKIKFSLKIDSPYCTVVVSVVYMSPLVLPTPFQNFLARLEKNIIEYIYFILRTKFIIIGIVRILVACKPPRQFFV
jgi:hypothetical protein